MRRTATWQAWSIESIDGGREYSLLKQILR